MVTYILPLIGGLLIGFAVTLMLLINGRVTGISGIIGKLFDIKGHITYWRVSFILGLLTGGIVLRFTIPENLISTVPTSQPILILAGLLVGYGTQLGEGCTSGHGICGVSRLSIRSIVATLTFMVMGIAIVSLIKHFGA